MQAKFPEPFTPIGCKQCLNKEGFSIPISMAFQPIWNSVTQQIFSQEALVRGTEGQPANWVFNQLNSTNIYYFDQACRVKAIELASRLKLNCYLNINFLPNAVYRPETCIQATLQASEQFGFSIHNIIFEVSEMEKVHDESRLVKIFSYYKQKGFQTAIDDFGAGYSGLKLLSRFIPDYIKIDMELIRNINGDDKKFKIVESIFELGNKLNIQVIAEGVETIQEYRTLKEMGLYLFQGYLIAKPGFETLPTVTDSFSN